MHHYVLRHLVCLFSKTRKYKYITRQWDFIWDRYKVQHKTVVWRYLLQIPFTCTNILGEWDVQLEMGLTLHTPCKEQAEILGLKVFGFTYKGHSKLPSPNIHTQMHRTL